MSKTNGKVVSLAKLRRVMEMPHFLDIQTESFAKFLQVDVPPEKRKKIGLQSVFEDAFPVTDIKENYRLEFVSYEIGEPKYDVEECRERDMTYAAPLKATLRLVILEKGEGGNGGESRPRAIVEKEAYLGDLPLLTALGTFIINGAERVIVSQLHRSPGVVFEESVHSSGQKLYSARIIPFRGSWVELSMDVQDVLYVHIDRKKKFPVTALLRAMGPSTEEEIVEQFYTSQVIDLSKKGAWKQQRRRLLGTILAQDVVDQKTGEVLAEKDEALEVTRYEALEAQGVTELTVYVSKGRDSHVVRSDLIRKTLRKDPTKSREEALVQIYNLLRLGEPPSLEVAEQYLERLFFNPQRYDLARVGRYKINERLGLDIPEDQTTLTLRDFVEVIRYLMVLRNGEGYADDIDHLGNRRVRSIGELIANQMSVGLTRMARLVRERMSVADSETINVDDLVNARTVSSVINTFFGSSQLSQFMDQTNPLAELAHKRRLSALGPGGLTRERAGFEVRDVHYSHYGRMCPIETPEGPNIGLITSLSTYACINDLGFIETPYRVVKKGKVTDEIRYLPAGEEDQYVIAQANAPIGQGGRFLNEYILCRQRGDFPLKRPEEIDFMDVAPEQLVSVAAALIPFLEHDDANRALMGSNMQRQAVPLLSPEAPVVGTGLEEKVARDSGAVVVARRDGMVEEVSADKIVIHATSPRQKGAAPDPLAGLTERDTYRLKKFERTNQDTTINQRPLVRRSERVKKGQIIADGAGTQQGKLALGVNTLVAFMPWYGYNFEDAIVISESLVKEDKFTSVHIQELELHVRDTKMGQEEITREIPNVGEEATLNLDERGIIRVGAYVRPGDILVGKISPKGETELSPEERLLTAIFGEKARDVKDTSLQASPGLEGVVIDVKVFSRMPDDPLTESDRQERKARIKAKEADEIAQVQRARAEAIRELLQGQTIVRCLRAKTRRPILKKGTKVTAKVLQGLNLSEVALPDLEVGNGGAMGKLQREVEAAAEKIGEIRKWAETQLEKIDQPDELPPGVVQLVKVYVAEKRKLSVGDKMAGRHGNKGVIARIVPEEDMPYLPDGTPVEIVLNPLGVPSRMNVGQVLETHLGWAAKLLGMEVETPVFHGATEGEIKDLLEKADLRSGGKTALHDGKTGEPFEHEVAVGYIYMMKLLHLVDDKIHARSIGPYSLVTQQPLAGKAQFGGQRFGEMEVWALEAYGAAHTLQEMLTVKSDDVTGRSKVYEAIVKGENLPEPGIPESFNVLVKELQALGLSVELGQEGRHN